MKISKVDEKKLPGQIRVEAEVPPGTRLVVYVDASLDGTHWKPYGPFRPGAGDVLNIPEDCNIRFRIETQNNGDIKPLLKGIRVHLGNTVIERDGAEGEEGTAEDNRA